MSQRLIIGITGASGAIYGVRLLEVLKAVASVETHLVMSAMSAVTLTTETNYTIKQVQELADVCYTAKDLAASISSGSFETMGMIVAPCSMRSLAEIATSLTSSLLTRAADVTLKERRKLVLMVRETPLTLVHLRNMVTVTEMGGVIAPPVPAFYNRPSNLGALVDHTVGRMLDLFHIPHSLLKRWEGLKESHS